MRVVRDRDAQQGPQYICVSYQRGVCSRSINAREVAGLIEEAVLSVFARIALTPDTRPARTSSAEGGRECDELAVSLKSDRAALDRLDDDHYDGVIDKATWMRQRNRLIERIGARQREYQQRLARVPVVDVTLDLGTVATEWPDRTATWQHEAARTVLESVLIHAHPRGVPSVVAKRTTDTDDTYQTRLRAHREELLARRVEFVVQAEVVARLFDVSHVGAVEADPLASDRDRPRRPAPPRTATTPPPRRPGRARRIGTRRPFAVHAYPTARKRRAVQLEPVAAGQTAPESARGEWC